MDEVDGFKRVRQDKLTILVWTQHKGVIAGLEGILADDVIGESARGFEILSQGCGCSAETLIGPSTMVIPRFIWVKLGFNQLQKLVNGIAAMGESPAHYPGPSPWEIDLVAMY